MIFPLIRHALFCYKVKFLGIIPYQWKTFVCSTHLFTNVGLNQQLAHYNPMPLLSYFVNLWFPQGNYRVCCLESIDFALVIDKILHDSCFWSWWHYAWSIVSWVELAAEKIEFILVCRVHRLSRDFLEHFQMRTLINIRHRWQNSILRSLYTQICS